MRDKWDQYKGVGIPLDDPYVNYRRNKSYNFVARMKAREKGSITLFQSAQTHVHWRKGGTFFCLACQRHIDGSFLSLAVGDIKPQNSL